MAGMPPSIADTGIGLASKGGPGTPLRDVGGNGTLMAAARAAAAAVGGIGASEDDVGGRGCALDGISIFISLGPGVEVFDEAPLLLFESVEPSFCIFSLLPVAALSLGSTAEAFSDLMSVAFSSPA